MAASPLNFFFKNSRGERIAATLFSPHHSPPKGLAVFCHAFGANRRAIWEKHFVPRLLRAGWAAFSFDFPGCGESGGDFADTAYSRDLDTLRCALAAVRRKMKVGKLVLVGHSRGGACAIIHAASHKADGLFLMAPRSFFGNVLAQFTPAQLAEWKRRGRMDFTETFAHSLRYSYILDLKRRKSPIDVAARIRCPVRIVHGTKDESVPLRESEALAKKLRRGSLKKIPGADHFFHGFRDSAAEDCLPLLSSL